MSLVSEACKARGFVTPHSDDWVGVYKVHGAGIFLEIAPYEMRKEWEAFCLSLIKDVKTDKAKFLGSLVVQTMATPYNLTQMVGFLTERTLGAEHGFAYRRAAQKDMNQCLLELAKRMDG